MAWYRAGGGGIPSSLKTGMNSVLNKKFGTSTTYDPAGWPDDVNLLGKLPEKTASGAIASFSDGADAVPLKSWEVTLPASLSGYSEVNGVRTGKNLFDKTTATIGKYINVNGQEATNEIKAHSVLLPLKPSTSYYMSGYAYGSYYSILALDKDMNVLSTWYGGASKTEPFVATTPNNARWCYLNFNADQIDNVIFAESTTAIPYEPYSGTQYTASLGRTIYGGTAKVVNGTGTETYKGFTLDNLTWLGGVIGGQMWCWYVDLSAEGLKLPANSEIFSGVCDNYTPIRYNGVSTNANTIALRNNGYLYVNNGSDTVQPTGKVTIELATPTDFTFTPITPTPETALGTNNFWADEDDSEVTYRADIDLLLGGN